MTWDFTVNLFETTTRRRFAVMDALIRDHASRCAARARQEPRDATLAEISVRATSACTAWEIAWLHWRNDLRIHRGRTHRVKELLEALRGQEIARWQQAVHNIDGGGPTWRSGNARYSGLFPRGRRPFQQGGIDSRIAAVAELAARLEPVPAMASAAVVVREFHRSLETARRLQQQEAGSKKARSAALEIQRRASATVLYQNMARLMEKYAETPREILTYFDLKAVRKRSAKPRGGEMENQVRARALCPE